MKYHRKEKLSIFSLVFGTWCDRDFDIWEQNCNNVTVTWRIEGMTSYPGFDTFFKKENYVYPGIILPTLYNSRLFCAF